MKPDQKMVAVSLVLCILVGVIAGCTGYQTGRQMQLDESDDQALYDISTRLGTDRNWEAVTHHVYCQILTKGRPRQELEQELLLIDGYYQRKLTIDNEITYVFYTNVAKAHLSWLRVLYDSSGRVQRAGWMHIDTPKDIEELIIPDCSKK
jgi:hypothetical protein